MISKGEKLRRLFSKNPKCFYCERLTVLPVRGEYICGFTPDMATLDHIIPRIHGGTFAWVNLVLACQECNAERGHLEIGEFLERKKISLEQDSRDS